MVDFKLVLRWLSPAIVLLVLLQQQTAGQFQPLQPFAQTNEDNTVRNASAVLDSIMAIPASQIPQGMLANARGVAIVPGVVKGGFVVGIRHGKGVILIKDDRGNWLPPNFVSLTGGSIGWQAGIQSTDVVLVFKSRNSLNNLMQGKFTIGVDAAAAAGPVGRNASAGTDARLSAEIYSYSRSRGLFAGASIDGSALEIDHLAGMAYYRSNNNNPHFAPALPDSAVQLMNRIAKYSGSPARPAASAVPQTNQAIPANQAFQTNQAVPANHDHLSRSSELVRQQLASTWSKLSTLLDEHWSNYLALPNDILQGGPVKLDQLYATLKRYQAVSKSPDYATLANRHEFSATYQLLREYASLQTRDEQQLTLPPPPLNKAAVPTRDRY